MPDRTQTLSVTMTRERAQILATPEPERSLLYTPADQRVAREELHRCLSQPEHQGDEADGLPAELVRALRDPSIVVDADRKSVLADGKTLAEHLEEWRNAPSNTVSADPSLVADQPSAPVLSDEERERLREIADWLGSLLDGTADEAALQRRREWVAFLRNLASREHRGEEAETKCERCKGTGSIAVEDYRPGEHQCHFSTSGWRCPECEGSGRKGFELCDNCERPARDEDLKTIWCKDAESGEAVDARICLACRSLAALDELAADLEAEASAHRTEAARHGDEAEAYAGNAIADAKQSAATRLRKKAAELKEGER